MSEDRARRHYRTVVFALYNKVTLQDVAAPLEIFARANDFGGALPGDPGVVDG